MALKAPKTEFNGNKNFVEQEAIEAGTYMGRVVQVIDLGLQEQPAWQEPTKPPAHEIQVTYELVDEFMKDENGNDDESKPRWVSERFPLRSLNSDLAKSTKRYKAIDPTGIADGDWSKLIGCCVMVTLVSSKSNKTGKIYNNVANLTQMRQRDKDKCPELKNEGRVFSLDEPDMEVFNKLPKWVQDLIKSNLEYNGSILQKKLNEQPSEASKPAPVIEEDDNAPF